jgi:two-component system sensor histidine kinase QseC
MTIRLPSIQSRLILLVLGALLIVELVTAWTGYRRALHEADELLDAQLAQYAQIMLSLAHEGRDDEVRLPDIKAHPYQSKPMFQIWEHEGCPRLMLRFPRRPTIGRRRNLRLFGHRACTALRGKGRQWLRRPGGPRSAYPPELRQIALSNMSPICWWCRSSPCCCLLAICRGSNPCVPATDLRARPATP